MLSVILTLTPARTEEGVILAKQEDQMRVALPGAEDILELHRVRGRWMTEDNTPIELEALFTDRDADSGLFSGVMSRVVAAVHSMTV